MADFWVLAHVEHGPISTFLTREEAERELERVFGDEPTWVGTLKLQPFDVVTGERGDVSRQRR